MFEKGDAILSTIHFGSLLPIATVRLEGQDYAEPAAILDAGLALEQALENFQDDPSSEPVLDAFLKQEPDYAQNPKAVVDGDVDMLFPRATQSLWLATGDDAEAAIKRDASVTTLEDQLTELSAQALLSGQEPPNFSTVEALHKQASAEALQKLDEVKQDAAQAPQKLSVELEEDGYGYKVKNLSVIA